MWTPAIPACLHVYSLTFLRGCCLGAGWTQSNSELHVWTFPTAAEYKKINENKNSVCTEQGMKALCSQGRGRKRAIALNYFYNWSAIVPGLSFSPMSGKVFNNSSHFWNHLRLVDALFMWLTPVWWLTYCWWDPSEIGLPQKRTPQPRRECKSWALEVILKSRCEWVGGGARLG